MEQLLNVYIPIGVIDLAAAFRNFGSIFNTADIFAVGEVTFGDQIIGKIFDVDAKVVGGLRFFEERVYPPLMHPIVGNFATI